MQARLGSLLATVTVLTVALVAVAVTAGTVADRIVAGRGVIAVHQSDLALAAAARLPAELTDPTAATSADLDTLARAGALAGRDTRGPLWTLAGLTGPHAARLRARRRTAGRLAPLAADAATLRTSLPAVIPPPPSPPAIMHVRTAWKPPGRANVHDHRENVAAGDELDRLDALARDLNEYATDAVLAAGASTSESEPIASQSIAPPPTSAQLLRRAALAAGLLPDLAGAQAARTWTVCRTAIAGCRRATLSGGELVRSTVSSEFTIKSRTVDVDVLITGVPPDSLFQPTSLQTGTGRHPAAWNVAATFRLLCSLPDRVGVDPVAIRSVVPVEQLAIDQLSRPAP